jgi:hypothetical protein
MRLDDIKFKPVISQPVTKKTIDKSELPEDLVTSYTPDNIAELQNKMARLQKEISLSDPTVTFMNRLQEIKLDKSWLTDNVMESTIVATSGGPLSGMAFEHFNTVQKSDGKSEVFLGKLETITNSNNWHMAHAHVAIGGHLSGIGFDSYRQEIA